MRFNLVVTTEAQEDIDALATTDNSKYRKVLKTLALMQTNIRHPGLHTHEYTSLHGPNGEKVFEAYVENKTGGAYRVFWFYGPVTGSITVVSVTPHP
jgi:hypothetical protein